MSRFEQGVRELQNRVMEYVNDSLDGKIPQCQKMLWGMQRFMSDLKRTNDKESKFYIDWNELYKFYRWSKMFKHSKGVLANQHIDLHVSQLYEATNIFCFKRRDNGARRFREVYIQKARKNAKTQFLALVASYIGFLSDEQEEIYIAGWSREQSNLCYKEILHQINKVDMLQGKYTDSYHHIRIFNNGTTIKALSQEARRMGDGTNPSLSIIDEYGTAHKTNEIVDVLKSGMVARKEPLMIYITTAGFDLDMPAFSFYNYCSDILNPESEVENDDIFVAIYEIDAEDNIKDEEVWVKANPIVSTYEAGMESLRSELKLALDQPERMRNFLTKNMNLWVDQKDDGFISLNKWKEQVFEGDIDDFMRGASVYFGIDLSATTDLTSIGWVAVKAGEFLVGQHSYMPEEKFKERMSRDKVRFDIFEDRGELTLTPGAVVDYNYLKNDLLRLTRKWGVKEVGFDAWNAIYLSTELLNEGLPMVEIPQSITQLSEPTKSFREKLYQGVLFHSSDQLLTWAIGNAIVHMDANENLKINKARSRDRIDPVSAIINAYARAMYDDQIFDMNSWILSDEWSL